MPMQLTRTVRAFWEPVLAGSVVLALIVYMIFGPTGLYAWGDYSQKYERKSAELRVLKQEQAQLENRVKLLDPQHADPDLVEELVRRDLGVAHPDDVIVPMPAAPTAKDGPAR